MRRIEIGILVLLLAACSSDSTVGPIVTPPDTSVASLALALPATLTPGSSTQATVVARNSAGAVVTPSSALTWRASNPSVATVDSTGVVTAVTAGTDTISVSSGSVVGRTVTQVSGTTGSGPMPTVVLSLDVGQSQTLTPTPQATGFQIPAGNNGTYAVIVANVNSTPDQTAAFQVRFDSGSTATSGSYLLKAATVNVQSRMPVPFGVRFEQGLRAYERNHLQRVPSRSGGFKTSKDLQVSHSLQVGDVTTLHVPGSTNDPCSAYATVGSRVQAVGDNVIILSDTTSPSGGFTASDYASLANEFDQKIYPTDTAYFGHPSDIDNNKKVLILFTPQINKMTPAGSQGFLGGFFFAGDLFQPSDCASSNSAEIFYLLAPDPTGQFNNVRTTAQVRQSTRGTIAHEFQHMINSGNRMARAQASNSNVVFEDVWLDEALAHLAEGVVGRAEDGYAPLQRLGAAQIQASQADYVAFYFQNTARFGLWAANPSGSGANSAMADTSLAVRGAAWSLLRHAADWHSNGTPMTLTRQLASGAEAGIANLTHSANASWETLVTEWLTANVADGQGGVGATSYASYDMRSAVAAVNPSAGYPLAITSLSGAAAVSRGSVASGSGSYYMVSSNGTAATRTVRLLTSDGTAPATFPGARLVVVRLK